MGGNLPAEQNWAEWGLLGLTALGMMVGALMRISAGEKELNGKLADVDKQIRADLAEAIAAESRSVGETMLAVRQKTTEVEIWVRDNLVRRDEFTTSVSQINRGLDALRAYVEKTSQTTDEKLERMRLSIDGKLDKIIGGRSGSTDR
jgi:hypothetical protein